MNRDEIISIARESGIAVDFNVNGTVPECDPYSRATLFAPTFGPPEVQGCSFSQLERFAALVAAHERRKCKQEMCLMEEHCAELILIEREACAKVCEELETHGYPNNRELKCAAAIRARSTKE